MDTEKIIEESKNLANNLMAKTLYSHVPQSTVAKLAGGVVVLCEENKELKLKLKSARRWRDNWKKFARHICSMLKTSKLKINVLESKVGFLSEKLKEKNNEF